MHITAELGYIGLEVGDLAAWRRFAGELLGLGLEPPRPDGSLPLRMDGHSHRFLLREGPADDLAYLGWQVADATALDTARRHLSGQGIAVTEGTAAEAAARGVVELIHFRDPDGLRSEAFHGLQIDSPGWRSPRMASGYVTAGMGMGHVLLKTDNLPDVERFWRDTVGFRLSDSIEADFAGNRVRAAFLHVNPRHHSLALAEVPGWPKRLQHFMLQVNSLDDVGVTLDRCHELGVPVALSLGRHPNDRMVSFYGVTPSGFFFEIGSGAITVDDSTWETRTYDRASDWGHRPQPPHSV